MDHVFSGLEVRSDGKVDHPVLITEAFCNLGQSRKMMTELLFETYSVPKLSYTVDFMTSYLAFKKPKDIRKVSNGLVLSFGNNATHVAPFVNNRFDKSNVKR
jgi:actin-related protein 5